VALKRQPLKPAKRTGVLAFPKSGPVEKIVEEWPRTKEEQELLVVEMFAVTLAAWHDRHLTGIHHLPEADHDAVAFEAGARTEIQVTELVTRDIVRDYGGGAAGWKVGDFDQLLLETILKKVPGYGPTEQGNVILLVYSVDTGAFEFTEFGRNDPETGTQELVAPEPLRVARRYLAEHGAGPFDEVWLTAPSPEWAQISPVFPPLLYEHRASP